MDKTVIKLPTFYCDSHFTEVKNGLTIGIKIRGILSFNMNCRDWGLYVENVIWTNNPNIPKCNHCDCYAEKKIYH